MKGLGGWMNSPKAAAFGIALLLFAILLAMESSGAGVVVLGVAIVGLAFVIFA
jgi:hypothetical protein